MPKLFEIGGYTIFFWSNENNEPIHVHIVKGTPSSNATKVWLTKNGGCVVAHNKGQIPQHDLNEILDAISISYFRICDEWKRYFLVDDVQFYC